MKPRKPLKRGKPLAQRSAKKVASDLVLDAAREERRRLAGGWCEGNTPGCARPGPHRGVLAHHVNRRKGQPDVHAVEGLRWLCWEGHDWVHANIEDARQLGLLA